MVPLPTWVKRADMIDIEKERLLPISQVPDKIPSPRRGCKLGSATVYRWINQGLETVKIGGVRLTSIEALARFAKHSQKGQSEKGQSKKTRTLVQRPPSIPTPNHALEARKRIQSMMSGIN
jgi:hypothetical protein